MEHKQHARIMDALCAIRCGAAMSEEEIHTAAAKAFDDAGLDAEHEVRLAPGCRIDFMIDAVGVEIKKSRPQRARLLAQLVRYAACERVEELIVVAPRGVNLPREIGGKPVFMLALERLWGIFLP